MAGSEDTRASPSEGLFRFLEKRYGLSTGDMRDLSGSLNRNLLFHKGSERVVVRVYRQSVGPARLADVQIARREVDLAGVPCAQVVPALDGAPFTSFEDRLVEVERFVEHDGRMNTFDRLRRGLPWLGRIHSVLSSLSLSAAGRDAGYVNHISAGQVLAGTALGTARMRGWGPTPAELELADQSDRLAAAVAAGEASLAPLMPRQLVHGDFWDNNVYFRSDEPILVGDFDFMGERARIDDLALTLYFADWDFDLWDTGERIAALRALVDAYCGGLDQPLSASERAGLAWSFARQPLWCMGGWVARLADENHARSDANDTAKGVVRALLVVDEIDRWVDGFS